MADLYLHPITTASSARSHVIVVSLITIDQANEITNLDTTSGRKVEISETRVGENVAGLGQVYSGINGPGNGPHVDAN